MRDQGTRPVRLSVCISAVLSMALTGRARADATPTPASMCGALPGTTTICHDESGKLLGQPPALTTGAALPPYAVRVCVESTESLRLFVPASQTDLGFSSESQHCADVSDQIQN